MLSLAWNNAFKPHWLQLSGGILLAAIFPLLAFFVLGFLVPSSVAGIMSGSSAGDEAVGLMAAIVVPVALLAVVLVSMVCFRGLFEMANTAWSGQTPSFGALVNFKAGLKAGCAFFLAQLPLFLLVGVMMALSAAAVRLPEDVRAIAAPLLGLGMAASQLALQLWLLPLSLVVLPFAANPEVGIVEGLRQCWQRGSGRRLQIFLLNLLASLCFMAGFLACGIGILPAAAFVLILQTGLWKALSRNATQP